MPGESSGASGAAGLPGRAFKALKSIRQKRQGSVDQGPDGFGPPSRSSTSRSNTINTTGAPRHSSHSSRPSSSHPEPESTRPIWNAESSLSEEPSTLSPATQPESMAIDGASSEMRPHHTIAASEERTESSQTTTRTTTEHTTSGLKTVVSTTIRTDSSHHAPVNSRPPTPVPKDPVTPPSHPVDTPMSSPPPRTPRGQPVIPAAPHHASAYTYTHTETRSSHLTETDIFIRHYVYKLGDPSLVQTRQVNDLDSYLGHIEDVRLRRLPEPGSDWDRILHAAQFFGLQLWGLGCALNDPDLTDDVSTKALTKTQTLLVLGLLKTRTLLPTFLVFQQLSVMLSHMSRASGTTQAIEPLERLYRSVVALVEAVASSFRDKLTSTSKEDMTLDFTSALENEMDDIWTSHRTVLVEMWLSNPSDRLELLHRRLRGDWSERDEFYGGVTTSLARVGGTCEWFQHFLVDFLENTQKTLAITGAPGTGKSTLAHWIEEWLLVPLEGEEEMYVTLTYAFPFGSRVECTQLSFLRRILLQLFEKRIGDSVVYANLERAFEEHGRQPDARKLEKALWDAFASGLEALDSKNIKTVIILDGVERVSDEAGIQAAGFLDKILDLTAKFHSSRLITLSEVNELGGREVAIPAASLNADIETYYLHALSPLLSEEDKYAVANCFGTKTEIPFLWAYFMVQLLRFSLSQVVTSEDTKKVAKRIGSWSLDETLENLIPDALLKDETTRTILSFMLIARRPPTIVEVSELLVVDTAKAGIRDTINVQHHVTSFCSDIVVTRNGVLHFKSSLVRNHVLSRVGFGHSQLEEKKAHRKLAEALLLYIKVYLEPNDITIPSFDALNSHAARKLTSSFGLLRYALEHWETHLHESDFDLSHPPAELRDVFPKSYRFALMQWTLWRDEHTATNLADKFVLFLRIQEAYLGKEALYTLQTLVILALIHEQKAVHEHKAAQEHKISNHFFDAASYYYQAASLVQRRSKDDLRFFSSFVARCAESCLSCIGHCSELDQAVMERQEEMIRLLVTVCSIKYGHSSEYVMRWYLELAKLYITLQRFADAQALLKDYPSGGDDTPDMRKRQKTLVGRIYSYLEGLNIEVIADFAPEVKSQYERFLIGVHGSLGTDVTRDVTFLLQVARSHESAHAWIEAESTYISLWRRVTVEFDASQFTIQRQKDKLHVGLQYAECLHTLRRDSEAAHILILLWDKHERYSWHDQSIVSLFRRVAFFLKKLGRFETAHAIFTKIWKDGNIEEDSELEVAIQEVTDEIFEKSRAQVIQVEIVETILKRRFEQNMVSQTSLSTSYTLAKRYMMLEEWEKAERILTQALRATWENILTPQETFHGPPPMPKYDLYWSVCLAVCLAELHDRRGQIDHDEASGIWLRASHVCHDPSSNNADEQRKLLDVLVQFVHWQTYHQKILNAFLGIFKLFRDRLEPSDTAVIGILYHLVDYSERLGNRTDAYGYCIEIVTALNKDSGLCHKDACRAALKLIDHYHRKRLWVEHENVCKLLWQSFVHRHVAFTAKEVQTIYEGYISALERRRDDNDAFSTMETISIEFRDTVKTIFAQHDFIVIFSGIAVAAVLENSESWIKAAHAYEQVIKTTQVSETTRTIIKESKRRLSAVYIKIFTSSELSTQAKASTIHEAIKICEEVYEQYRAEYGCWRIESLDQLKAVIILRQFAGQESDPKIVELFLCKAFQDIVTTATSECDPLSLYDAAKSLAFCFVQARQEDLGLDLAFHGRHWSVFPHQAKAAGNNSAGITFTPDKPLHEECYVFFASFEQTISKRDLRGYAELMAAGRRETFLHDKYKAACKRDSGGAADRGPFVLVCGANLRLFWSEHHEHRISKAFEDELLVFFQEEYSSFLVHSSESPVRMYLLALLVGLQGMDLHKEGANFAATACQAGFTSVRNLLEDGQFQHALDVAKCAFHFASKQEFYKDKRHVPYAFSLAELMAGVNIDKHPGDPLHTQYLDLSGNITAAAMKILSEIQIDIASLHLDDHRGIIRLLGYQKNYKDLKSHLSILRKSHLATSDVPASLSLSYLSIHADAADATAPSSLLSAISTCRTLAHNLQQTRGPLDDLTLSAQETLSSLYAKQGSYLRSIEIHEGILRHIESTATAGGSRSHIHWDRRRRGLRIQAPPTPSGPLDKEMLSKVAGYHLTLLMYAHARSGGGSGGWTQKKKGLDEFCSRLQKCLGSQVKLPPGEVYESGKVPAGDQAGLYAVLRDEEWVIEENTKVLAGAKRANYAEAAGTIWGWVCEVTRRGSMGLGGI